MVARRGCGFGLKDAALMADIRRRSWSVLEQL